MIPRGIYVYVGLCEHSACIVGIESDQVLVHYYIMKPKYFVWIDVHACQFYLGKPLVFNVNVTLFDSRGSTGF